MQQLYGGLRFGLLNAKAVVAAQGGSLAVTHKTSRQSAPFRLNFKILPAITP